MGQVWNLRELSAVFQGLCLSVSDYYNNPMSLARLWRHECFRVYGDRLIDEVDTDRFGEIIGRVTRNNFEDLDQDELQASPLIFSNFAIPAAQDEKVYFQIDTYDRLKKTLQSKLGEYNESNAKMDLVLFEQVRALLLPCRASSSPTFSSCLRACCAHPRQNFRALPPSLCHRQWST